MNTKPVVAYASLHHAPTEGESVSLILAEDHPTNPSLKAGDWVQTSGVVEVKSAGRFETRNTEYVPNVS